MFDHNQHISVNPTEDGKYTVDIQFIGGNLQCQRIKDKLERGFTLVQEFDKNPDLVIFKKSFYNKILKELNLCQDIQKQIIAQYNTINDNIKEITTEIDNCSDKKKKTRLYKDLETWRVKKRELQPLRRKING